MSKLFNEVYSIYLLFLSNILANHILVLRSKKSAVLFKFTNTYKISYTKEDFFKYVFFNKTRS